MTLFLIVGVIGLVAAALTLIFGEAVEAAFNVDFLAGDSFSLASMAAFLGAFGFGGVISLSLVPSTSVAVVVGLALGAIAAWGAISLTRWLKRSESLTSMRSEALVGSVARVITAIPSGGYGEVLITLAGESHKRSARADRELPAGTEVWVMSILSPTAVEVASTRTDVISNS